MLLESGIDYEVRTTADPQLLTKSNILKLAAELFRLGVKDYVLQRCRPVNPNLTVQSSAIDLKPDLEVAIQLNDLFETFSIRTY